MSPDFLARGLSARAREAALLRARQDSWFQLPPAPVRPMAEPPTITTGAGPLIANGLRTAVEGAGTGYATLASQTHDCLTYNRAQGRAVTVGADQYGGAPGYAFYLSGHRFALRLNGTGAAFEMRVDGARVAAEPLRGAASEYLFDFGIRSVRRIDLSFTNQTAPTLIVTDSGDQVAPAPNRGPRCIVMTDSFGASSTAADGFSYGQPGSFVEAFAAAMGWDDVWNSGVGGTGYLATAGGAPNWRDRIQHDVVAPRPDVVVLAGTGNDNTLPIDAVIAATRATWAAIRDGAPDALVFAGPNTSKGVGSAFSPYEIDKLERQRNLAAELGVIWCSPSEMPVSTASGVLPSGTVGTHPGAGINSYAAGRAGSAGIVLDCAQAGSAGGGCPISATVEIGAGATRERLRLLDYLSGAPAGGLYAFMDALKFAHQPGEPWRMVGSSYVTGTGHVGAETGVGNADLYCGPDGVHPTFAGAQALGLAWANVIRTAAAGR